MNLEMKLDKNCSASEKRPIHDLQLVRRRTIRTVADPAGLNKFARERERLSCMSGKAKETPESAQTLTTRRLQ